MANPISAGAVREALGSPSLESGTGTLRLAKVERVDSRKMVVDLLALGGTATHHFDVPLSFPGAGVRNFIGAMPEVTDLCIIGYGPMEGKKTGTPLILSWVIPNPTMGYDWIVSQFFAQEDLALTPAIREAMKGLVGRRRHKQMILDEGNVGASSSQGADMLLDESATLTNRRGNELILRDQDQAFILRTLQQFHVGAGFRVYGGIVQRDATFLPTQMVSDDLDWSSTRQVDETGAPLSVYDLDGDSDGFLNPNELFYSDKERFSLSDGADPYRLLARAGAVDENGYVTALDTTADAVYGGKPIGRINRTGPNATGAYSEYRIEVSNETDGTLPVSEQTDGFDIDRLPPDPDSPSPNAPIVEFVLGTAIGNDVFGTRDQYGKPLKATATGLVPVLDTDDESVQIAFLIRVKNPVKPDSPPAFMAITKGGAFVSYFPGKGSKGEQIYRGAGQQIKLGLNADGSSYQLEAEGAIEVTNTAKGRPTDNIGVDIESIGGAVRIAAGAARTDVANEADAISLTSAQGVKIEGGSRVKIAAPSVEVADADTVTVTANTAIHMKSGTSTTVATNVLGVTVSGRADYTFGGPKDALLTNGPSRNTTFTANPATGGIGGTVDDYTVIFGGRKETFVIGRHDTNIGIGSYNVTTVSVPLPVAGFGDGINLSAGPPLLDQKLELASPLGGGGATLTANLGNVTMRATKGQAVVQGVVGVAVQSLGAVTVTAPAMQVIVPTVWPGGVLTDGCIDGLTGRPFITSGSVGTPTFRVGV